VAPAVASGMGGGGVIWNRKEDGLCGESNRDSSLGDGDNNVRVDRVFMDELEPESVPVVLLGATECCLSNELQGVGR
jgi:hypothetical protein